MSTEINRAREHGFPADPATACSNRQSLGWEIFDFASYALVYCRIVSQGCLDMTCCLHSQGRGRVKQSHRQGDYLGRGPGDLSMGKSSSYRPT